MIRTRLESECNEILPEKANPLMIICESNSSKWEFSLIKVSTAILIPTFVVLRNDPSDKTGAKESGQRLRVNTVVLCLTF